MPIGLKTYIWLTQSSEVVQTQRKLPQYVEPINNSILIQLPPDYVLLLSCPKVNHLNIQTPKTGVKWPQNCRC